jgi:hypothetical protein
MPLRLTILHFEQRFFTDEETFISVAPSKRLYLPAEVSIILKTYIFVQPDYRTVKIKGSPSVIATLCSK